MAAPLPRPMTPSGATRRRQGRVRPPVGTTGMLRQLEANLAPQELDELLPRQLRREARRLAVPAAALGARDARDVDAVVGRAQRDLALAAVRQAVADQRGDRRPLDRAQVVDDALGVVLLGVSRAEVVG